METILRDFHDEVGTFLVTKTMVCVRVGFGRCVLFRFPQSQQMKAVLLQLCAMQWQTASGNGEVCVAEAFVVHTVKLNAGELLKLRGF